jgi:hypothetical protein
MVPVVMFSAVVRGAPNDRTARFTQMTGFRVPSLTLTLIGCTTIAITGCGGQGSTPTSPSSQAPATSTLTYHVAAGTAHTEASGTYTTANASFRGSVRTTCVPNPNIAGSVCPDLMVLVQPVNETFCQLWAFAPLGETLTVRSYPRAQRGPGAGVAGLSFNCAKGGTTCNWSVGQFTLHELQSDPSGTVMRLHIAFEQTCSSIDTLSTAGFGKGTGELWIINGTTPY